MVRPYGLVVASGMWYVVAHCEKATALRVFRLDRIGGVEVDTASYDLPTDFSVDRVLESARGLMQTSAPEPLRVRYSPNVAKWIAEREGLELTGDGSVVIDHPLLDEQWAVRHVLQYGADAEVLSPSSVRKRLAETLRHSR